MIVKGKRLTDPYIQKLKPPTASGQQDEYFDAIIPGLAVRIGTSGVRSFVYLYRYDGKPRRMTLGRYDKETFPLEQARDAAREARSLINKGHDPAKQAESAKRKNIDAPTVGDIADDYLEKHAKRRKRTWEEDERILNKDILPLWRDVKAQDIKRTDVVDLLDDIVARGAPVGANRTLAVIRRMYNFAVERSRLEMNPAWKVKAPHREQSRSRTLSEDEIRTFWNNLPNAKMSEGVRLALKLILVTGQRPGEVAGIHLREIDGNLWSLPGSRTKNRLDHTVPLSKLARGVIEEARDLLRDKQRKSDDTISDWLFPALYGDRAISEGALCRAISKNLEDLEVEKFTPHDLRRTAMTLMGKIGVSRFVQDRVANHKDQTMGGVYDRHTYDKEKRQALDRWAGSLKDIVSGNSRANVVALHG